MGTDLLRGTSVRWTYDDGPMAGKVFEHAFADDGTVTWRDGASPSASAEEPSARYEVAPITDTVYAVSYLAASGWALTTVVDRASRTIVSFASNEKTLVVQHGKLL